MRKNSKKEESTRYTLYRGVSRSNLTLKNLAGSGGFDMQMLGQGLYLTPDFYLAELFGTYVYELELEIPEHEILRLTLSDKDFATSHVIEHPSAYLKTRFDEWCNAAPSVFKTDIEPFICTIGETTYVVADCDLENIIHKIQDELVQMRYGIPSLSLLTNVDHIRDVRKRMEPLTNLLSLSQITTHNLGQIAKSNGYKVLWVEDSIIPHEEVLVLDKSLYDNGLTLKGIKTY